MRDPVTHMERRWRIESVLHSKEAPEAGVVELTTFDHRSPDEGAPLRVPFSMLRSAGVERWGDEAEEADT